MRAFLAFEVSQEVVDRLLEAARELRATGADVSTVGRENLHFTVKFLGEIEESSVEEIDRRVKSLDLRSAEVLVRGVGAFPNAERPRVVWAGVAPGDREKVVLPARAVIESLEGIGRPEDREYHAHVTLGRVRSQRADRALTSFIAANASREFGKTQVHSLKLKSSTLTPRGPIYTDVREYALK